MNELPAWAWAIFIFLLQLVTSTIVGYTVKRWFEKRDKKQDEKETARLEYEQVMLEVTDASAKLSYALAMAIKRGSPNGEVEAGIKAYNESMKNKNQFLQKQALYRISN